MKRRQVIGGAAALAFAGPGSGHAADAPGATDYDGQTVRTLARTLAAAPFKAPDTALPTPFDHLGYDQFRQIRFDANQALWRNAGLQYQAQFFHRGWLFLNRVDMFEVADGKSRPIVYRPDMFSLPPGVVAPAADIGFAGVRLHAPLNRPDYFDEVAAFLGASYFRAVARGLGYGLSARALSLGTGDAAGEEFPFFRAMWLERPAPGNNTMVVAALVDSPSATAALRITIRPGDDTVMDVELAINPRVDLAKPGIATGTSMFLFDNSNRNTVDDWRGAVHDSDGLLMLTGRGEQIWRPLADPRALQVSSFVDSSPRGFGLMQRARDFRDYEDLEARYEKRPSLWVEPIGDWGEGVVQLVEIPTKTEINDNIVAFWRPKQPLRAKVEHGFTYRLHWCKDAPIPGDVARFTALRTGPVENGRVFVLDVAGPKLKSLPAGVQPTSRVTTNTGTVQHVTLIPNPEDGTWRLAFELLPGDAKLCELRAVLLLNDAPLTETWVFRWTA